jgi:hypothetical protein
LEKDLLRFIRIGEEPVPVDGLDVFQAKNKTRDQERKKKKKKTYDLASSTSPASFFFLLLSKFPKFSLNVAPKTCKVL